MEMKVEPSSPTDKLKHPFSRCSSTNSVHGSNSSNQNSGMLAYTVIVCPSMNKCTEDFMYF
jgi:hypothetical protein